MRPMADLAITPVGPVGSFLSEAFPEAIRQAVACMTVRTERIRLVEPLTNREVVIWRIGVHPASGWPDWMPETIRVRGFERLFASATLNPSDYQDLLSEVEIALRDQYFSGFGEGHVEDVLHLCRWAEWLGLEGAVEFEQVLFLVSTSGKKYPDLLAI